MAARGNVGQPVKFANTSANTGKFGTWFIAEDNYDLVEWRQPNNMGAGTGLFRVGVFADNAGSPGAFLGDSSEITINTTDQWWNIPFTTFVNCTKDSKYWVLGWCNGTDTAWYAGTQNPDQRTYIDGTGTYPTWANPANATNGTTIVKNDIISSGYGVFQPVSPKPMYLFTTSIPIDDSGATNTATQNTWTPAQGLQQGDLVLVYMQQRGTATHSVGVTGGQTWSSFSAFNSTLNLCSTRVFYCTFNGTWSASPRFDFSAGTCTSVIIEGYRPPGGTSSTWAVDQTQSASVFAAAATITITGVTNAFPNTVTVGIWVTADDNTWIAGTGTDWYGPNGVYQFRNTSGTDQSMTTSHKIMTAPGATGNVSRTQDTLGNDAGARAIFSFYEVAGTRKTLTIGQAVKRANSF